MKVGTNCRKLVAMSLYEDEDFYLAVITIISKDIVS